MARRLQAGCGLQNSPQQSQVNDTHRHERRQGQAFLLQHGFRQWINHRWRFPRKQAHGLLPDKGLSLIGMASRMHWHTLLLRRPEVVTLTTVHSSAYQRRDLICRFNLLRNHGHVQRMRQGHKRSQHRLAIGLLHQFLR